MTTTTTERNDDFRRTRRKNKIGGVRTEAMARGKRKGIADIIGEEIDGQEKKKKELCLLHELLQLRKSSK